MQLPYTARRVTQYAAPHVNREIEERTRRSIAYYQDNENEIDQRLQELDREWDIERLLEANASALILVGSSLGFLAGRKFFAIPLVVSGFLLQHALGDWCPPLAVLRRMGFRTAAEIQEERDALENIYRIF